MKQFKNVKQIKSAIIGYGKYMGKHHGDYMKDVGMKLVAIADPMKEAREAAKNDWPDAEIYNSATELLKKSDAKLATIITPHNTHAPLAIQCLNAGVNVITEKPMAVTTQECDNMIAAAKKNNGKITNGNKTVFQLGNTPNIRSTIIFIKNAIVKFARCSAVCLKRSAS